MCIIIIIINEQEDLVHGASAGGVPNYSYDPIPSISAIKR